VDESADGKFGEAAETVEGGNDVGLVADVELAVEFANGIDGAVAG
jgi:hypothetical protein